MTIYLITHGDENWVLGAYSTMELAEKTKARLVAKETWCHPSYADTLYDIEEHVLDVDPE